MKHKILIVGRKSNIINLNLTNEQNEYVDFVTATNVEETQAKLNEEVDAVIIGAGLEKQTRQDVYEVLLDSTTRTAVFCNAKDTGPEGLENMVKVAINYFKLNLAR